MGEFIYFMWFSPVVNRGNKNMQKPASGGVRDDINLYAGFGASISGLNILVEL